MKELINSNDKYKMNWIKSGCEWGRVKCPSGIECGYTRNDEDGIICERFVFTNTSPKHIFTSLEDISICAAFNDSYTSSQVCRTSRCHMHIFCGGEVSYVMALRMGGEAPHLGLALTKGSLGGYSIERDFEKSSNDRGALLLHPSPAAIAPNESITIEWKLFWHGGKADFYERLPRINPKYISVEAENYTVFKGEKISVKIKPSFDFKTAGITKNGESVRFVTENGIITLCESADSVGEIRYDIDVDGIKTFLNIYVQEEVYALALSRCRFITRNQQYNKTGDCLDGAYLAYDNEEEHPVYSGTYDLNAARERVGMGLLIAEYLKTHHDNELYAGLMKYAEYVKRELFIKETGEITNDCAHDNEYKRLYNYPWYSRFFIEMYHLTGGTEYLDFAYRIIRSFYAQDGAHFYAIDIPICEIMYNLKREGMTREYNELMPEFIKHGDAVIKTGLDYPAHEVNYEQSIVAQGADILLQIYELTRDEKYLDGAKIQLAALEMFNGLQPDYHLYETAIRHWDGYWFGKRKLYGDTFPHYWSALTGNVYERYGRLTENREYINRAEQSLRGVLPLIFPNGRGSCAYIYPVSVNGIKGRFYDPYANDQDWGLYFYLRHKEQIDKAGK